MYLIPLTSTISKMKLPEPIIFTKDIRRGLAILIQLLLEASIVIGVFIAGLVFAVKTFGPYWIFLYGFLFMGTILLVIVLGHYYY